MNDKQIVEYARKLVLANLQQYADNNPGIILGTVYKLQSEKSNKLLLEHLKGLDELIQEAIKIIERNKNNGNKRAKNGKTT